MDIEPPEIDALGGIQLEPRIGRPRGKRICKNQHTSGLQDPGGDIKEVVDEAFEIADWNPAPHRRIADDLAYGTRCKIRISKITVEKFRCHAKSRRRQVALCHIDRLRAAVGPQKFPHAAEQSAFDQLQTRTAKRIPDDIMACAPRQTSHAGREGRMRGRRDIQPAVGETGVRRKAWAEFHGKSAPVRVNLDSPGSASGIVQQIRAQGIGTVGDIPDEAALVAEGWKFQAIADRAFGESLKKATHSRCRDERGDFGRIQLGDCSQDECQRSKAAEREQIRETERTPRRDLDQSRLGTPKLEESSGWHGRLQFLANKSLKSPATAQVNLKT